MTDTPSLTAEERACRLMSSYSVVWGLETASDRALQLMIEIIATAIREAEDAAYERAAAKFDHDPDGALSMRFIAMHIRSLKSQEP